MLTLFHAPQSRSSRIVTLIDEMGITDRVIIHPITIRRQDGTGAPDPANPHPEGKAPALLHGNTLITESAAIILYLTELFPGTGLAPDRGTAARGDFITWLCWYGGVMEPALLHHASGVEHPWLHATFRGVPEITARLTRALSGRPFLLGDSYSAADLLVHSPYVWFKEATPDVPSIRDWVARCQARPAHARTREGDARLLSLAA